MIIQFCLVCGPGTEASSGDSTACIPCPMNKFNEEFNSTCTDCPNSEITEEAGADNQSLCMQQLSSSHVEPITTSEPETESSTIETEPETSEVEPVTSEVEPTTSETEPATSVTETEPATSVTETESVTETDLSHL